ncbi:polyprenyl synthetase family protein [Candidatus Spongiihabitans sp.]|uniref:polyprenyl synthetase family protein n=1 Tax=Candidatus Spongiihabitans sp. TaxID=3101308 RepID=UPI003C6F4193
MSEFESVWESYSQRTEKALQSRLINPLNKQAKASARLHQAMEYACLGGGKRLRAMLVYACGEVAGADLEQLDTPACAVEMAHAYSLVHDDLPAMDDDDLRRGRASCHIAFDEATAVLVGDALQSRAFEILASNQEHDILPIQRLHMVQELAFAIGSLGMAGGQALDMEATGKAVEYQELVQIHRLKTGALIKAAATMGGLTAQSIDSVLLEKLAQYASSIGLAFQIADDILDHTADSETLGKSSSADHRMNKATYISLLGVDAARAQANKISGQAIESIQGLGDNGRFLEQLAQFVVTRSH